MHTGDPRQEGTSEHGLRDFQITFARDIAAGRSQKTARGVLVPGDVLNLLSNVLLLQPRLLQPTLGASVYFASEIGTNSLGLSGAKPLQVKSTFALAR